VAAANRKEEDLNICQKRLERTPTTAFSSYSVLTL